MGKNFMKLLIGGSPKTTSKIFTQLLIGRNHPNRRKCQNFALIGARHPISVGVQKNLKPKSYI